MDTSIHTTFMERNRSVYQQNVYLPENARMASSYDRLLSAAEKMKGWLTPSEVATGLTRAGYEVTPQKLTNWKSRGMSMEGMIKSAPIIGCRSDWLQTGDGPMEDAAIGTGNFPGWANVEPGPDMVGSIPLISWVQAGDFCGVVDLLGPGEAEQWIPVSKRYGPHAYALRVQGDSMVSPYPGTRSYPPGYIIFVDPDRAITNGCRVIAKIPESNEATFKIYSEDAGGRFLKPLNPQYPTRPFTDDMVLCGVVVGGSWEE